MLEYYEFTSAPTTFAMAGSILGETDTATFVDVYAGVVADITPVLANNPETYWAVAYWRAFIKSDVTDPGAIPAFDGAVPRYKLGRYTLINSDFYDEVQYISYVQAMSKQAKCLIAAGDKPALYPFTQNEPPISNYTIVSLPFNYFGAQEPSYMYATDILLDPVPGVTFEYLVAYTGFVLQGVRDFGTVSNLLANY